MKHSSYSPPHLFLLTTLYISLDSDFGAATRVDGPLLTRSPLTTKTLVWIMDGRDVIHNLLLPPNCCIILRVCFSCLQSMRTMQGEGTHLSGPITLATWGARGLMEWCDLGHVKSDLWRGSSTFHNESAPRQHARGAKTIKTTVILVLLLHFLGFRWARVKWCPSYKLITNCIGHYWIYTNENLLNLQLLVIK